MTTEDPSLSVLAPVAITDTLLTSSTCAETDYPPYSGATTYGVGTRCISPTTHKVYESLRATNLNNDPTNIANTVGTTPWWLVVGPTNKYAMFDGEISTATTVASPLTVVIKPGALNSLYLAGLDADNLAVTVKDATGGNVIFDHSGALEASAPGDYYEHFYDRFKPQTDFIASGIDTYNGCEVTVTLTKVTGNLKCGILAVGDLKPLGSTQYGAKAKPKTYSAVKLDAFGNNTIVRRKSAMDMSASAFVALEEANYVLDTIRELLDVPCVWVGTNLPEYGGLRVFGLGSAELSYDFNDTAVLSLTVQGLI